MPLWRLGDDEQERHPECAHLPLVFRLAGEFWRKHGHRAGLDYEELVAEGWIVLRRCWQLYDPARGNFAGYAARAVKYGFWDLYYDRILPVHIPHSSRSHALARRPAASRRVHRRNEAVRHVLAAGRAGVAECAAPPDEVVADADELAQLRRALRELPEGQRQLLAARFGLDGAGTRTLREIGEEAGLTRERVRQLEAKALHRLRELLQ